MSLLVRVAALSCIRERRCQYAAKCGGPRNVMSLAALM